jgi:4-aminobutyrate aminotransferase
VSQKVNQIGPEIKTPLPGPRAQTVIARDREWVSQNYVKDYPFVMDHGEGVYVYDVDGNRFLDFAAGIAVCSTGHCHPRVTEAIRRQAGRFLSMCATDFYYDEIAVLAERLARLAPGSARKRVFLTNSGAEAVETAIKLARLRTGRQKIVAFFGAFHGRTMGAASLTASKPVQRQGYAPMLPEVHHTYYATCYRCPVNRDAATCNIECLDHLEKVLFRTIAPPKDVAAIFVEPVLGEGGYYPPKSGFLERLAALAREHGILLVADEIQSGLGRTGKMFAVEHFGIEPDVILLAKGIASGMPLSAVIARDDVMKWQSGGHGSTFGGNPVSCAAALATVDLIENELAANAARVGSHLRQGLEALRQRHAVIGDVRGLGLMQAIDLVRDRESKSPAHDLVGRILEMAFEKGLLLLGCGSSAIRFAPPLIVNEAEVDCALSLLDEVLGAL